MGMFIDGNGKTSSSRVSSFIVMMVALLLALITMVTGCFLAFKQNSAGILMGAATASGTVFVTVGGASMYFMYNQKKSEIKAMEEVIKTASGADKPENIKAMERTTAT